jgi:hypothetical protein
VYVFYILLIFDLFIYYLNTRSNTAVCLTLLLPTNITMQEVKYDYSFSGAGGASDSSGVTWKIYLEGNTSGKPAG